MDELIVSRLREVGFSLYEARLYVALVRGGTQNGNEVANLANVPSSKVYAALDKLAGEGIVESVKNGSSTRFTAIRPQELVARLRKHYNSPLDFLEDELPKVASARPPEPFLTVTGEVALREAACAIIDLAREELYISCWQEDIDGIGEVLRSADARGVRIHGMLYGHEGETLPGGWLNHHYIDIVGDRVEGRLMALVADEEEALIARFPRDAEASAVRSRNRVVTMIVQEYLHHDNMLQRAQEAIGFDEWDRWWQADPRSRAEILGHVMRKRKNPSAEA